VTRGAIATLLVFGGAAFAQPVPGTGGDPLRERMREPAFVDREFGILAMRGGSPADAVLLFDGFELSWAFHDGGVRSIIAPGAVGAVEVLPGGFGVEYGRGSSVVALSSEPPAQSSFAELSVLDATLHEAVRGLAATARSGTSHALAGLRDLDGHNRFGDAVARVEYRMSSRWLIAASGVFAQDDDTHRIGRPVMAARYRSAVWRATLALSPLWQRAADRARFAVDTRAEVLRAAAIGAGLTKLEWRLGQQTKSTFVKTDAPASWRHDVALWSSLGANLSSSIRATAGLRVDSFDGELAMQPRGDLTAIVGPHVEVALRAGAYRRPPDQDAELTVRSLHPERATEVEASVGYRDGANRRAQLTAYYIDRTHLVVRDELSELRNTGLGTSTGVELSGSLARGPWSASVTAAALDATRRDFSRAAERPAEYEQPFRIDLLAAWTNRRLRLAARFRIAAGLPYTPYIGAVYDSDRDSFEPLYVPPYSARTPVHHQLDIRCDYRMPVAGVAVDAFVDLHNAYRNEDAIAYRYGYDYRERTPVSALPVFPFAGLRATL
jgi:hypothetical protein